MRFWVDQQTGQKQVTVRIEFYGIARHRAGCESIDVEAATLGDALQAAADRLPRFGTDCVDAGAPAKGFLASINGDRFTTDASTALASNDAVLILSADVGG